MQDLSRFVPNVHFEQIPIKNLVSNQEYQRPLSQAQVEKAIEDFDLNQINPVKVSRRDGINYVFNGQHTIEIVATVSGSRETPVWCMIYDSLDYQNEADIFANQMKHVLSLIHIFRACPDSPDFFRWHFRKCHEVLVRYLESPGEDLTGKFRICLLYTSRCV